MKTIRFIVVVVFAMSAVASAQWLKYPTAGIPRTADGKPDLTAPTPRHANGKPVLAGLWRPAPGGPGVGNIARNLKEPVPFQPWAEALFKERQANNSRDDPTAKCVVGGVPRSDLVGYPYRILEVPGMVAILYEAVHAYRQIFTDGRELPKDPNPAWFGYSVGKWDGDAFVVTTTGFNDNVWLDNGGRPATDAASCDGEVHSQELREHGHRNHDRRPEGLHEAVDRGAAAGVSGGHRAPRIHLQREQQVLRDHSEADH